VAIKKIKKKKERKVKVVSKTLKSMIRFVGFWYIEQQIQKEFVRVPRRYTRVIFFCSSAMLRFPYILCP